MDGIVGRATWYAIVRLYTAVTRLSELRSQGQQFYAIQWNPSDALQIGSSGESVRQLQYMLSVLSSYIPGIPNVTVDGIYGTATRAAVLAAQRRFGLPETGVVNEMTWNEIYDQYSGIENTSLRNRETFPGESQNSTALPVFSGNSRSIRSGNSANTRYSRTPTMTQFPGYDLRIGAQDPIRQEVVR